MGADPAQKLILFTADETAAIDAPETWRQANPALGDFLNIEEIKNAAEKAIRMPSFESAFRNLHLNQRVSPFSQLFSRTIWEANGGEPDLSAFERVPVYGGLDLSATTDLTALVLVAEAPAGVWNVWPHFWTPADTLHDRAQRDRVPYDIWARRGFLTTVPGVTIDFEFVAHRLAEVTARCQLEQINFDRWAIERLKAALDKIGTYAPLQKHGQGYVDMTPALNALETVALQGKLRHGNNPVLAMNASNSIVTMDAAGNRKLDKAKSTGRIDGMVALAMAVHAAMTNARPPFSAKALIG
jgi:phage terminase large subunit-like protein